MSCCTGQFQTGSPWKFNKTTNCRSWERFPTLLWKHLDFLHTGEKRVITLLTRKELFSWCGNCLVLNGGPAVAVLKLEASLCCNQTTASSGGGSRRSRSPVFILGSNNSREFLDPRWIWGWRSEVERSWTQVWRHKIQTMLIYSLFTSIYLLFCC